MWVGGREGGKEEGGSREQVKEVYVFLHTDIVLTPFFLLVSLSLPPSSSSSLPPPPPPPSLLLLLLPYLLSLPSPSVQVTLAGDLKHGRTVHSLARLLTLYKVYMYIYYVLYIILYALHTNTLLYDATYLDSISRDDPDAPSTQYIQMLEYIRTYVRISSYVRILLSILNTTIFIYMCFYTK